MAQPKITVSFNGKIIGTRRTDRKYSHALVLTDFNEDVARGVEADQWRSYGKKQATNNHAYYIEQVAANDFTYSDEHRARRVAALPVEEYVQEQRAAAFKRLNESIARRHDNGTVVLSYHGSAELALKAQAAAAKVHSEYTVRVVPVDA